MRLKQGIAIFCSIVVLMLSSGLTLHQMKCVNSGHVHLQLSEFDGCCESPGTGLCKSGCCDYSEFQLLTNFDFFEEAFDQSFDQTIVALWRPVVSYIFIVEPNVQVSSGLDPPDDLITQSDYQSLLQVYRI